MAAHEIQQPLAALSPPTQTYQSHMPPPSRPPPTAWTAYQNPLPPSPQQVPAPDIPLNYSLNQPPLNFSISSNRQALLESMKRKVYEMEERDSVEFICNNCPEYEKQNVDLQNKIAQIEKSNAELGVSNKSLLCETLKLLAFKSKVNAKLLNMSHSTAPSQMERPKMQSPMVSTPSQHIPTQQHHTQQMAVPQVSVPHQPQFTAQQYQQLSNQHVLSPHQLTTNISTQQRSSPHFSPNLQPVQQVTYVPTQQYVSNQQQSWMPSQEQELMPPPPPLH